MEGVRIIDLPKFKDERGNLSFLEDFKQIPFKIERVYWIFDVPGGEVRGGHAFRRQCEFIISLSGSFDVVVSRGNDTMRISLNRSYFGLYIPNGYWRHMENFSTNAVALVLSSTLFDETDYIREFDDYLKFLQNL